VGTRVPSVVTVHDLGFLAFPESHTAFQRWHLGWSTKRHVRLARAIVADSEATRRDLAARLGADPSQVYVAHLGVGSSFRPSPHLVAAARAAAGVPAGARFLLHVGTVQPRKNLPRLAQAFAQLATRYPDLHLVLSGARGWGSEAAAAGSLRSDHPNRVHVAGYMEEALLPGLYSAAEATVVPSLYEGFGLTALEAMACGTPVVASNTSSLPEVVGDAGLLVDPLDTAALAGAIELVLTDEALASRLRRAGLERARQFTWDATAQKVLAAIETAGGGGT
jgi:glycosyltransferase involved in cell wall biosynthesis